jgi:hypothetical protein
MAISLKHPFTSGKADGADSTLVQPSNWNAEHTFTMATARLLGRVTASTGTVEELTSDQVWAFIGIVSGTKMLFAQTAAPIGFTKDTTHNDKALRVVSGTAGSGGSTGFTTVFAGRTIAQANLPNVNLSVGSITGTVGTTITNGTSVTRGFGDADDTAQNGANQNVVKSVSWTTSTLSLASGTVTFGGDVPLGGSGTAMDFAVQYVDVIIATKS